MNHTFQDWSKTSAGPHFIRTEVFDKAIDSKLLYHLSILTDGKPIPPINIHEPVGRVISRPFFQLLFFNRLGLSQGAAPTMERAPA